MGDFFKAFGRFLARDIFYILSGLYVCVAVQELGVVPSFAAASTIRSDVAKVILLLGTAYVVGFTVKELFAFLHLTIEAHFFQPKWPELFLYRLHQRKKWTQPQPFEHERAYVSVAKAGADVQSRYDRISDVIHMCSSTGASLLVSSAMLAFRDRRALIGVLLGIMLLAMSRFQAMRRMRFLAQMTSNAQQVDCS
jgi:hypothetical protein